MNWFRDKATARFTLFVILLGVLVYGMVTKIPEESLDWVRGAVILVLGSLLRDVEKHGD